MRQNALTNKLRVFVGACCLWLAASAHAQAPIVHVVHEGETLSSIAKFYYNDTKYELVLLAANHLKEASEAVPGVQMIVPSALRRPVQDGESWASIARETLGSESKAEFLASVNGATTAHKPIAGSKILIPYVLPHRVQARDSVVSVAQMYLGAGLEPIQTIQRYNGLTRTTLKPGSTIWIPIANLFAKTKAAATISEQMTLAKECDAELDKAIAQTANLVREAKYVDAVRDGNQLLSCPQLRPRDAIALSKSLAIAYVALNRLQLAEDILRRALALDSKMQFDAKRTSPKVLEVFELAKQPLVAQP